MGRLGKFFEKNNLKMGLGKILGYGLVLVLAAGIFGKDSHKGVGGVKGIGDFGDDSEIDCKNIFCWRCDY